MRFIFKTKYSQDINIAKHNGDRFWYSLLILIMVALPLVLDDFYLGEISYICILSIAGIGLMILSGYFYSTWTFSKLYGNSLANSKLGAKTC